jgi:hypothetical protein
LPKITRPNFLYLINFPILLGDIWAFFSKGNPRAKALGPNQNKNAQIQLVKLSKQEVFVKLKNLSDTKIRSCYFTFEKIPSSTGPTFITGDY